MSQFHTPPEQHPPGPRVLWGRVGVAVVVIVLAFSLGRCGGGEVPEDEVARLRAQVTTLESENDELRAQVDRLEGQAGATPTDAASSEPSSATEPTDTGESTDAGGSTDAGESTGSAPPTAGEGVPGGSYTIAPGDSLYTIATKVYDDREMAPVIADANGLAMDATLQVGQVLQLPEGG